ncbi:MAG: Sec-independent protein translocase protein TatB [Alphaproteobacteria bacterium]
MFGISGYEAIVIGIIALIVIGPKDLPKILRTVGHWMGKAQRLANEFRRGLDQMAKESGVDDVKRQVEKVASLHPANQVKKAVLGTGASTPATPTPPTVAIAPVATKTNGAAGEPAAPPTDPTRATGT